MSPESWTAERVAILEKLWGDGLSSGQIAKILKVTRNTVIGKASRMKLRRAAVTRPSRPKALKAPKPSKTPELVYPVAGSRVSNKTSGAISTAIAVSRHVPALTLVKSDDSTLGIPPAGRCKFPLNEKRPGVDELTYCGAPQRDESSYCAEHHAICWYTPVRKRGASREDASREYVAGKRKWP